MKLCEILTVGTELLLGEIVNTNASFLCAELAAMGIAVQHVHTVGDHPGRLHEAFVQALARSDVVLLTGGLGPTPDDLTKETVAEALGLPLHEDPEQRRRLEAFFAERGRMCAESNFKQALVPQGCEVLYNEHGTAPGCWIKHQGKAVALLPGPPFELQALFCDALQARLQPYASGSIVSHHLRCIGLGESRMAELCADWLENSNPTVAPYAQQGESSLRVSAFAPTPEAAEALCAPVLAELQQRLGHYAYAIDESLAQTVLRCLQQQGKTVAIAESCTGGGIAAKLTDLPGASAVFGFGFVTYANEAKQQLLGVQAQTLQTHGAVSEETAREMAEGARLRSGASYGLAVTGIAGPDSDGSHKPPGLVFAAVSSANATRSQKLETGRAHRAYNRECAAGLALRVLLALLLQEDDSDKGEALTL